MHFLKLLVLNIHRDSSTVSNNKISHSNNKVSKVITKCIAPVKIYLSGYKRANKPVVANILSIIKT